MTFRASAVAALILLAAVCARGAQAATILLEPFAVVEEGPGSYVVADRTANAVYRLRGGELTVVARVPLPRDLARAPGGRLLVASGRRVVLLDPATGRAETIAVARAEVLGVARMADGAVVASELGSRIVRFAGGKRTVLADGLDGVHGLLPTSRGLVACESSTGRVLLLTPSKRLEVLASGLDLPSFAAPAPAGAVYLAEFGAGRISRLAPSGKVTAVGSVADPAGISVASNGDVLAASLDGSVVRIDPRTHRVRQLGPR